MKVQIVTWADHLNQGDSYIQLDPLPSLIIIPQIFGRFIMDTHLQTNKHRQSMFDDFRQRTTVVSQSTGTCTSIAVHRPQVVRPRA